MRRYLAYAAEVIPPGQPAVPGWSQLHGLLHHCRLTDYPVMTSAWLQAIASRRLQSAQPEGR
jgi:hypothetical protein